jgi:hypothetical protein
MTNNYFDHDTPLTRHTLARAEALNSLFSAIEAGFDLLSDPDALNEGRAIYAADTGSANTYVVALTKVPTAYTAGMSVLMKVATANTGASTVDVNELGVKTIKRFNGNDLSANDLLAGMIALLVYDGTNFRLIGHHGASETNAAASASAAASSASAAATSASNAATQFTTFRGIFYGALASDPALDPNGNAPDQGDFYYNTTTDQVRVFDGTAWGSIGAATKTTFVFTAEGGETSLSGNDDNAMALAYTIDFLQVFKNGARLVDGEDFTASTGNTITGLDTLAEGDVIQIDAYSRFDLTDPNSIEVTATGSSTARTLADRFADVVNVKDFGATGDGATDDAAAIQAAIDAAETNGGGDVYFHPGTYVVGSALTIDQDGVILVGGGIEVSVIKASHSDGPALTINADSSGLIGISIDATTARNEGAAGTNYGVLVEPPEDTSSSRVRFTHFERFEVREQPSHGIVFSGGVYVTRMLTGNVELNLGHGVVFDNGTITSRTNTFQPGLAVLDSIDIVRNSGNALVVGGEDESSNRGVRLTFINVEMGRCAESAGTRKSADQAWVFGNNISFQDCAFNGLNIAGDTDATGGIRLAGKSISVRNCRYLNVLSYAVRIDDLTEHPTNGITIEELYVAGDEQVALAPAISMAVGVDGVHARSHNLTNITSLISRTSNENVDADFSGAHSEDKTLIARDFKSKFTATSIADDAVATITLTAAGSYGILVLAGNTSSAGGVVALFRVGTSVHMTILSSGGATVTGTTGALTGTTGADGELTISAHTDNKIYIENRTGGARAYQMTLLSMSGGAPQIS